MVEKHNLDDNNDSSIDKVEFPLKNARFMSDDYLLKSNMAALQIDYDFLLKKIFLWKREVIVAGY